jgi:hypothetical protein
MTTWTTAADLRTQVQRLWDKGRLLACIADAENAFPLRLVLKSPSSSDLSDRFDEARVWSRALQQEANGYRLVLREIRHRIIGQNALPAEAWIDSLDDALRLIGKAAQARRFAALVAATRTSLPSLLPWLRAHPLRALALDEHWLRLLEIVAWLQAHPRPGVYLRQVDLPGVHSKYIEEHAAVLCELFDLALPGHAVDASSGGANLDPQSPSAPAPKGRSPAWGGPAPANLARRYGFRAKPVRVRFRVLDPSHSLLGTGADEDIAVDHACFARLDPPVSHVFMTENEVNFLAFPPLADAMVVFGAGYGFDMLASARWPHERTIHYWGDIDTHGFAILDQLRGHFAHVESFLMDHATLMAHRLQWTDEPQPILRDLLRLAPAERTLFDDLRWKRLEDRQVRLEQERIGFQRVEQALASLGRAAGHRV